MEQHHAGTPGVLLGRIVRKLRDRFDVISESETYSCILSGSLRHAEADLPAVGDEVVLRPDPGGTPVIVEVRPRRNRLARRAAGPKPVMQIIAANLDLMVIVASAEKPRIRPGLIDRYLVEAERSGIPALVCVNKIDLVEEAEVSPLLDPQRSAGYAALFVSAETGVGLDALRHRLRQGTSVLVGQSGAGKTSLIRTLLRDAGDPGGVPASGDPARLQRQADPRAAELRVNEISRSTGKGKHTTSEVSTLFLPGGGTIIDTPGVREFALWDIPPSEVETCFPEMRPLLGRCRFGSCTHAHEPDCAVKRAVREGSIDPERYRSYLRISGFGTDDDVPPLPPSRGDRSVGGAGQYKHSANNERSAPQAPEAFSCRHCGYTVPADALGTAHRNHCPQCLWSLHVDRRPGDRAAGCSGRMEPIAITVRGDGEWALLHRCTECGVIKSNRIAGDDNGWLLLSLAARPLARPPFPIDRMEASGG